MYDVCIIYKLDIHKLIFSLTINCIDKYSTIKSDK